jgi:bacterioferritin (cytochrome b1)
VDNKLHAVRSILDKLESDEDYLTDIMNEIAGMTEEEIKQLKKIKNLFRELIDVWYSIQEVAKTYYDEAD